MTLGVQPSRSEPLNSGYHSFSSASDGVLSSEGPHATRGTHRRRTARLQPKRRAEKNMDTGIGGLDATGCCDAQADAA